MQKVIYIGIVLMCLVSCTTSQELFNKKNTSTTEYKESFHITDNEPKPKSGVKYYWYKSRKVQATQNDYAGELLNGLYTKYYYSNELAEKGKFHNGRKIGVWKSWYKSGQLTTAMKYKNGRLDGKSVSFDSVGNIVSVGRYSSGKRSGEWLFPQKGDTIRYHKGEIKPVEEKDSLNPGFFGKLFKKKAKDSINKEQNPSFFKRLFSKKGVKKNTNKNTKKNNSKEKPNFFQRLFSKKEKDNT